MMAMYKAMIDLYALNLVVEVQQREPRPRSCLTIRPSRAQHRLLIFRLPRTNASRRRVWRRLEPKASRSVNLLRLVMYRRLRLLLGSIVSIHADVNELFVSCSRIRRDILRGRIGVRDRHRRFVRYDTQLTAVEVDCGVECGATSVAHTPVLILRAGRRVRKRLHHTG